MSTDPWVSVPAGSGFGLAHLPYGAAVIGDDAQHLLVRIGDHALDLNEAGAVGLLDDLGGETLRAVVDAPVLNPLLAAGPAVWAALRARVTAWLTDPAYRDRVVLRPLEGLEPVLPWDVGDYVDFYSSEHHAANVGRMFRPTAPPLYPNWRHQPVGYHGRAGTVVVSGTDIVRPRGQYPVDGAPVFGPTRRLDIEAEVGFVVGTPNELGVPISTVDYPAHVFGVVLLNDWSARDLQAWETVPLGPFLGKAFATSVSAWVTPLAALAGARVVGPEQDPPVLAYLRDDAPSGLDLELAVRWNGEVVSRPPFATMYWSPAQQLAHLTSGGARVRTGDLYASGTVSGPAAHQRGSFLELTWNGTEPVTLPDGSTRAFLLDGDEVVISATAEGTDGAPITLGEVAGRVRPAGP
ncbi:MAG: fumarylacetoacetase [Mycobacterium sp.]|nr:fumarylacetoacetase [Mycobacterium sp.]